MTTTYVVQGTFEGGSSSSGSQKIRASGSYVSITSIQTSGGTTTTRTTVNRGARAPGIGTKPSQYRARLPIASFAVGARRQLIASDAVLTLGPRRIPRLVR